MKVVKDCQQHRELLYGLWLQHLRQRGYAWIKVTSFSMYPFIKPGDYVLLKPLSLQQIRIGDIIAFQPGRRRIVVVHRIVRCIKSGRKTKIIEKGDNSSSRAPLGPNAEIIGRVTAINHNGMVISLTSAPARILSSALAMASDFVGYFVGYLIRYFPGVVGNMLHPVRYVALILVFFPGLGILKLMRFFLKKEDSPCLPLKYRT